jgi:hypothetical protein
VSFGAYNSVYQVHSCPRSPKWRYLNCRSEALMIVWGNTKVHARIKAPLLIHAYVIGNKLFFTFDFSFLLRGKFSIFFRGIKAVSCVYARCETSF